MDEKKGEIYGGGEVGEQGGTPREPGVIEQGRTEVRSKMQIGRVGKSTWN